jgi:hypothetical protein
MNTTTSKRDEVIGDKDVILAAAHRCWPKSTLRVIRRNGMQMLHDVDSDIFRRMEVTETRVIFIAINPDTDEVLVGGRTETPLPVHRVPPTPGQPVRDGSSEIRDCRQASQLLANGLEVLRRSLRCTKLLVEETERVRGSVPDRATQEQLHELQRDATLVIGALQRVQDALSDGQRLLQDSGERLLAARERLQQAGTGQGNLMDLPRLDILAEIAGGRLSAYEQELDRWRETLDTLKQIIQRATELWPVFLVRSESYVAARATTIREALVKQTTARLDALRVQMATLKGEALPMDIEIGRAVEELGVILGHQVAVPTISWPEKPRSPFQGPELK